MKIRHTCAYILMVGGMLLFAGASQAQESISGNTGAIGAFKNSGATSHGIPAPNAGEETVRGGPARMLGEVQTGMTSGRASSGSYDPFGNMGTSGSTAPLGSLERPGLGAGGSIGGPGSMPGSTGSMGVPQGMGSSGVIGGR